MRARGAVRGADQHHAGSMPDRMESEPSRVRRQIASRARSSSRRDGHGRACPGRPRGPAGPAVPAAHRDSRTGSRPYARGEAPPAWRSSAACRPVSDSLEVGGEINDGVLIRRPPTCRRPRAARDRRHAACAARPQGEENLQQNERYAHGHEAEADRLLEEHRQVAARQQQGAAKILLDQRAQHVAEQDRRDRKLEREEYRAGNAEYQHLVDLEQAVVGAVDADGDEEQRTGKHVAIRHLQHLDPHADQRHVENDEQDIADPEARDQAPEQIGVLADELRARAVCPGSATRPGSTP